MAATEQSAAAARYALGLARGATAGQEAAEEEMARLAAAERAVRPLRATRWNRSMMIPFEKQAFQICENIFGFRRRS